MTQMPSPNAEFALEESNQSAAPSQKMYKLDKKNQMLALSKLSGREKELLRPCVQRLTVAARERATIGALEQESRELVAQIDKLKNDKTHRDEMELVNMAQKQEAYAQSSKVGALAICTESRIFNTSAGALR